MSFNKKDKPRQVKVLSRGRKVSTAYVLLALEVITGEREFACGFWSKRIIGSTYTALVDDDKVVISLYREAKKPSATILVSQAIYDRESRLVGSYYALNPADCVTIDLEILKFVVDVSALDQLERVLDLSHRFFGRILVNDNIKNSDASKEGVKQKSLGEKE